MKNLRVKSLISIYIMLCLFGSSFTIYAEVEVVPLDSEGSEQLLGQRTLVYQSNEHSYNNTNIHVRIESELVGNGSMYPVVINNRTLVPVREIIESSTIQAKVDWVDATKTVFITKDDLMISLTEGDNYGYINGEAFKLDTPALLMKDKDIGIYKMMVPIRFISESFGYDVSWDGVNQEVILSSSNNVSIEKNAIVSNIASLQSVAELNSLPTLLKTLPRRLAANSTQETIVLADGSDLGNNSDTVIKSITANDNESHFYIESENGVSNVSYQVSDDKLIVDIEGLKMMSFPTTIRMDNGVYVSAVRTSQYDYSPYVARIVFDLYDYSIPREIIVSQDRKKIDIIFNEIGLSRLDVSQDSEGDYISIEGNYSDYNVIRMSQPERLFIDFNHTINLIGDSSIYNVKGQIIDDLYLYTLDRSTTRLALTTTDFADFSVDYDSAKDLTIIRLKPLEFSGIKFDYNSYPTIVIPKPKDLMNYSIESIEIESDSVDFTSIISLNTGFSTLATKQEFFIGDQHFNTVSVVNESGKTKIKLANKHILEYAVTQDTDNIYISSIRPKDKYGTMVLIDAGHGGYQPGAVYNGLLEKDINLKLMNYIIEDAQLRSEIKYFYTRTTDIAISLPDRVKIANDLEVDLLVSMHNNAIDISGNPLLTVVGGMEVILTEGEEHSKVEMELAISMVENMRSMLPELVIREIKDYNKLYLLRYSDMPAVIIEYGYLTNLRDVENLKKDWILNEAARITELTIYKHFNP